MKRTKIFPKFIPRRDYDAAINKLSDLQLAIFKASDSMNPATRRDLTNGIQDIVGRIGGSEGIGVYAAKTLCYLMESHDRDWE